MRRSDDVALADIGTTGTTFNTAAVAPKGANRIGVWIDVDSSTGTSPTLDVALQISLDKGTTWANLPGTFNTSTQGALAQIGTTTGVWFEFFEFAGDPEFTRIRAKHTIAGTSPVYDYGACYWVLDYVAKG